MIPLVSAIMPTMLGREKFLSFAIHLFLRQTYPQKELLIVSDSPAFDPADFVHDKRVRKFVLSRPTSVGEKLNIGIREAAGDLLLKFDDDDWYHPEFIERTVVAMTEEEPERSITRVQRFLTFFVKEWKLTLSGYYDAVIGSGMMFHRALWDRKPFRDESSFEDTHFRTDHQYRDVKVNGDELLIVVRHGENNWVGHHQNVGVDELFSKHRPVYYKPIEAIVASEDINFYRSLSKNAS